MKTKNGLTVREVASLFGVTTAAVRYWIAEKRLRPFGRFPIRFTRAEIERFGTTREAAPERRGGARAGADRPRRGDR